MLLISNAYKNDNINALISPIKFRPFSSFDEIVENKFKIFAELSGSAKFDKKYFQNSTIKSKLFKSGYFRSTNHTFRANRTVSEYQEIFLTIDSVVESFIKMLNKDIEIPQCIAKFYNNSLIKFDIPSFFSNLNVYSFEKIEKRTTQKERISF